MATSGAGGAGTNEKNQQEEAIDQEDDNNYSFQTATGEKIPKTSAPALVTDKELFECDHIPLHLIGHIQGNTGHVVFVSFPLGHIVAVDANIRDLGWIQAPPGAPQGPSALLQTPLSAWVPREMQQAIMRAIYVSQSKGLARNFFFEGDYAFTVAAASSLESNVFAIEIEHAKGETVLEKYSDTITYISKLVDYYANESIVNMACDTMFELLPEYDRGMVYRFNADQSGEIVHEVRRGNLPTTYLGHRFPKYDIPLSSRQLYLKNTLRYIRSSAEKDVAIVSSNDQPVDLTHIRSRSVAKPHILYMQNMGVQCSLSIAIVVENELWGLFAFHGYKRPYQPSLHKRITCEAIAGMVSVRVESLIRKVASARIVGLGECMQRWTTSKSFHNNLELIGTKILEIIDADVLVGNFDGELTVVGDAQLAPSEMFWRKAPEMVSSSSDLVQASTREEVTAMGYSPEDCPASGFIYFAERSTQLFLGRAARSTDVKWGGNPDQPKVRGLDGILNPRTSFEIYMEKARKESKPWSAADLNVIGVLQDRICTGQAHEWMTALLKSDIEEANMRYYSLLDRDRDNSQFFAHMCHELRTPLHGIIGCLDIIHDSVQTMSTDEIKDLVATALGSGNHMINILNDILNQSKNKYLSNQPVKHTMRLTTLMEEIQGPLAVLAQNLQVEFTFEFCNPDPEEEVVCAVDRTKCIQIATNIINNALKFAKNSRVCVKAQVFPTLQKCVGLMEEWSPRFDGFVFSMKESEMLTSFDDAQMFVEDSQNPEDKIWFCLTVSDFGTGMKANELQQMFEPYAQGNSGWNDSRFQGTGLGLFISVSLCHQLGGFIACLSTHGVGTTFHIGIPVEVAHGKEALFDDEEAAGADLSKEKSKIPLTGSILIVDDNKVNLKLLRLRLEKELKEAEKHVDVIMADGGQAAVETYKAILPSVVIIDYHMPRVSGSEAVKAIREYEEAHSIHPSYILSYTADLSTQAADALLSSGSNGIMTKPPPKDYIANLVRRMEMSTKTKVMQNYADCVNEGHTEDGSSSHL